MGQGSEDSSYAQLFAELRRSGVLALQGGHCVFQRNYAFRSPSAAAAVVNGRPANGTLAWKVKGTNKTYKEWERENLDLDALDRGAPDAMASAGRHIVDDLVPNDD